jgi:hypothetical protein
MEQQHYVPTIISRKRRNEDAIDATGLDADDAASGKRRKLGAPPLSEVVVEPGTSFSTPPDVPSQTYFESISQVRSAFIVQCRTDFILQPDIHGSHEDLSSPNSHGSGAQCSTFFDGLDGLNFEQVRIITQFSEVYSIIVFAHAILTTLRRMHTSVGPGSLRVS